MPWPDLENAKSGLSLATYNMATEHKTASGLYAIVAGDADSSEMIGASTAAMKARLCRRQNQTLSLSAREKAILAKWIEQGAEYKKHWALIKPERPQVPQLAGQMTENPIDAFILSELDKRTLSPQARADKETSIRRISFDLTGLPPTLGERHFSADDSEEAYERLVDSLLDRPSYGERMATEWLDIARYADTHGYSTDFYRDMSPYRDWVIKAFNQNQAFDEFVTWQLAGDLFDSPTQEQLIATAFNRVHAQNGEGGIVNEEFRVEYVKDRVQTIGTGLMGLTMHCAQCHDHKYDAISAKDYYATYAFFNNIDEAGQISDDANDMPVPTLMMPSETQAQSMADLSDTMANINQRLVKLSKQETQAFKNWLAKTQSSEIAPTSQDLVAHYPLTTQDKNEHIANTVNKAQAGKVIFGANIAKSQGPDIPYYVEDGREAFILSGDDPLYFPETNFFDRTTPFTISIEANIPEAIESGVLFHFNKGAALYNFKGFDVGIEDDHWYVCDLLTLTRITPFIFALTLPLYATNGNSLRLLMTAHLKPAVCIFIKMAKHWRWKW